MVSGCLAVWVCGSVCVCVCESDPSFIQFALGSCYAVHIHALSIQLKCTSEGKTCKWNYYDSAKIANLLTLETLKWE